MKRNQKGFFAKSGLIFIILITTMLFTIGCSSDTEKVSDDTEQVANEQVDNGDDGTVSEEGNENYDEEADLEETDENTEKPKVDFLTEWKTPAGFKTLGGLFSSIHYRWGYGDYYDDVKLDFNKNDSSVNVIYKESGGMQWVYEATIWFDQTGNPKSAEFGIKDDKSGNDTGKQQYTDPKTVEDFIIYKRLKDIFNPFERLVSSDNYYDEALTGKDYGVEVILGNGPEKMSIGQLQLDVYPITFKYDGTRVDETKFANFGNFYMLVYRKVVDPNGAFVDENGVAHEFEVLDYTLNDSDPFISFETYIEAGLKK